MLAVSMTTNRTTSAATPTTFPYRLVRDHMSAVEGNSIPVRRIISAATDSMWRCYQARYAAVIHRRIGWWLAWATAAAKGYRMIPADRRFAAQVRFCVLTFRTVIESFREGHIRVMSNLIPIRFLQVSA